MAIKIKIIKNRYNIDLNDLMTIGNRVNNNKRNFLFISKVLGKHIEVKPDICRVIGFILASAIYGESEHTKILVKYLGEQEKYKDLVKEAMEYTFKGEDKLCVLGFAETATGLGMAVASAVKKCNYITTTRENITGIKSLLNFQEEHSHATTHKCFPVDEKIICDANKIVLVDDEITTGKSMVNIIKELIQVSNVKKYIVLSILDWRSDEHQEMYKNLEKEMGIEIDVISLISGQVTFDDITTYVDDDENVLLEETSVIELGLLERMTIAKKEGYASYFIHSGRFGVNHEEIIALEEKCEDIARRIEKIIGENNKILVLGHGENIYIPSRVASKLKGDIYFKSTTRSPIYCKDNGGYPIKQKDVFYDDDVKYHFYNRDYIEKEYDKVILITENNLNIKLSSNMIIVKI